MVSKRPLKVHPLADRFPMMSEAELVELAADIAQHGLKQPLQTDHTGEILVDGRNRLEGCKRAKVEPRFEALGEDVDLVAYILSLNVTRRHLNAGQRAILVAIAYPEPGHMGCATGRPQERDRPAWHDLSDARHAADVERLRQRRIRPGSGTEPAQADLHHAPHSDREGLAIGPRLIRHDGEELPAALRDIGLAWPHWNGGLPGIAAACAAAGFGALDDGPDAGLPAGLRNRAIAALGDAVVPQITQTIGEAMREMFP